MMLISIHAPREGGDPKYSILTFRFSTFQSTPPARGATAILVDSHHICSNFNPRPPRGGRPCDKKISLGGRYFNPRPPRGGRHAATSTVRRVSHFNPRPPRGGRLGSYKEEMSSKLISIHAPREGGDCSTGRLSIANVRFQSTPPARGATAAGRRPRRHCPPDFNPRPPRGGRRHYQVQNRL